ncbi:site-2 protease family protein [soil metagenome]
MKGSFPLARILGFPVSVDYSWFILFALILWSFSSLVFPGSVPGLSSAAYGVMGVAGALLFFASLLAHELAHAVVARRNGIPVDGITLFLFGGMARTRMEAETAGDEFQIAAVGPLMSFAVAALLFALEYAGGAAGVGPAVLAVLQYIAALNVVLAVFNLLPGFPLDGGRVLRAALWKSTGDATKATRWAAGVGQFMGYGLVVLGVMMAFSGNLIGGMWLAFIGWFLRNAAISSYQQHVLLSGFTAVRASQVMSAAAGWEIELLRDGVPDERVRVVGPDDNLLVVVDALKSSQVQRVLVVQDGTVLGVVTPADVGVWLERARGTGEGPIATPDDAHDDDEAAR